MRYRVFGLGLAVVVAIGTPVLAEDEPDGEQLVEALNAVFGKHAKTRASHAKGFCVTGRFTPAEGASSLSTAPHYAKEVPVLGRFSIGGGNPKAADNAKGARGLAIRFDPDDDYSDMVLLSAPIFFARTPAQVIDFLRVRAPSADGPPDPEKIKAFGEQFPETTKQGAWIAARPVPASYATANYWGIHAFTLINAEGEAKTVKFKLVPIEGEVGLTEEEANEKGPDFYASEFEERLGKGPAKFELLAMMGKEGDAIDDPTVLWEEEGREMTLLGTLSVEALEDQAVCDAITFDPTVLPEGIDGPEDDPIFWARSGAYAVSLTRRHAD